MAIKKLIEVALPLEEINAESAREKSIRHGHGGAFACFELVATNYPLQQFLALRMESRVRDVLINHVLDGLFHARGIHAAFALSGYNYQTDLPVMSNDSFEERCSYEFIVEKDGKRKGVRYTSIKDESLSKLSNGSVDEIIIINWEALKLQNGQDRCHVYSNSSTPILMYSVRAFFDEYFDIETYKRFITFVEGEVYSFHNYLGLTTLPKLTAPIVSGFRFNIEDTFIEYIAKLRQFYSIIPTLDPDIQAKFLFGYHIIDKEIRQKHPNIEQKSVKAIIQSGALDRFEEYRLWEVYIGTGTFSKSLMTSEYLYQNYKCDNKFDYTAIISGYLKCIEQLLYQLVLLYIKDGLYITPNSEAPKEKCVEKTYGTSAKKWKRIEFSEANLPYCDISLGSLIYFIKDNDSIVRFTGGWKKTLITCLFTFMNECRNDSFHKHNIDSWSRVEFIRRNTFILCIFIMGSCWVNKENKERLGAIADDRLERIYHHLRKTNYENYLIQFEGTEPVKMRRVTDIMYPEFNDFGIIQKLVLVFISPDKVDSENNPESILIYREHIPQNMWYINERGKNVRVEY